MFMYKHKSASLLSHSLFEPKPVNTKIAQAQWVRVVPRQGLTAKVDDRLPHGGGSRVPGTGLLRVIHLGGHPCLYHCAKLRGQQQ